MTTTPPLDNPNITYTVYWEGTYVGCGLDHYDIYYRNESAPAWTLWREGVPPDVGGGQAPFEGMEGNTYYFSSCGTDQAGNTENCHPGGNDPGADWPIQGDLETRIRPWSRVNPLPAYNPNTTFSVSWQGSPGVACYSVQVRDGQFGAWQNWLTNYCYTQRTYQWGQNGHIYYFRSQALQGSVAEAWPYDWDTYTKAGYDPGLGGPGGGTAPATLPPDEAPDLLEEVTHTEELGTPVIGTIAPEADVDWYRFEFTETTRVRVVLDELPADYDLYVFAGDGQFLYASTWWRQLPEEVTVRVPAGVYYVRLDGYAGAWDGGVPYRLLVEKVTGGP